MNILLTCAGRRKYLVRYFDEALGSRGRVLACDCSAQAPALVGVRNAFVVPPVDHPEYFDALLDACRRHEIGLLFSLNDLELHRLAQRAHEFRAIGTLPVISAPEVTALCLDKWATFEFLRRHDLPTPATFLTLVDAASALGRGEIAFPLIIKPRWGSGSLCVEYVENSQELELAYEWTQQRVRRSVLSRMSQVDRNQVLVIQQKILGQEYGLDVVNDLKARHVATMVRRKLAMRSGETDQAVTVHDEGLDRIGASLGRHLGHVGNLDCDVIVGARGPTILDLNPRFGGGYPFSHLAGANLPAAFIAWANQEPVDPAWLTTRPGVASAKYDSLLVVQTTASGEPGIRVLQGSGAI